jgi:GH35 family endo-1,4-beta-xylanase
MKRFWIIASFFLVVTAVSGQQTAQLLAKYTFENNLENEMDPLDKGTVPAQNAATTPSYVEDGDRPGTVWHQKAGFSTNNTISHTRFNNPLNGLKNATGATISLWIKRNDAAVFDAIWSFYDENTWGTNGDHDRLYFTPNTYLGYNGPSGWFDCNYPAPAPTNIVPIGEWAMLTVTIDASGFAIYMNGEKVFDRNEQFYWAAHIDAPAGSFDYANVLPLLKNARYFYLGFGSWWGSADLLIDDLSIYRGVVSDDDIRALYNSTAASSLPQWKREADARIEQHRKEDVTIRVMVNGQPVENAQIDMKMTSNEFLFGSHIYGWEQVEPADGLPSYNRRFAELLNFGTARFYWSSYERVKDYPTYTLTDSIAAWAKKNGIQLKGHPLIWNSEDPSWVSNMDNATLYRRILQRVSDCVSRFKGSVDTWDLINETVPYQNYRGPSPRMTEVMDVYGIVNLAKEAFIKARAANPNATLLINDYINDNRYPNRLRELKDNSGNYLFDVVGMQSHTHLEEGEWSNERLWSQCETLKAFGKPIHFSELTILSTLRKADWHSGIVGDAAQSTMAGEQWQKSEVLRYYTMLFSHPAVEAVCWWDFTDKNAWFGAPAGLIRADFSPKPAYTALKKLIKEEWSTDTTLVSDVAGEATVRAFRGKYHFTVRLPNGETKSYELTDVVRKDKTTIELNINVSTDIGQQTVSSGKVYAHNRQICLSDFPANASVVIYDAVGRPVKQLTLQARQSTYISLPDNFYLVKVVNNHFVDTYKLLLH